MPNDDELIKFLMTADNRISRRLAFARDMKKTERFREAIDDLERIIPESKAYFYGTRTMELGHPKSHLNIFMDISEWSQRFVSMPSMTLLITPLCFDIFRQFLLDDSESWAGSRNY
jgi:hypothetical protein